MDNNSVATAYIEAVGQKQLGKLEALLAPDLEFEGPNGRIQGAQPYINVLRRLCTIVVRNDVRRVFADGDEVCVIYDFVTDTPAGVVPTVEWMRVSGGRVRSIRLIFDRHAWPAAVAEMQRRATSSAA